MIFRNRSFFRFYCTLMAVAAVGLLQVPAFGANPVTRHSENVHGDFILIGNTGAQDCRGVLPSPVIGTIGACGTNAGETGADVFWQADAPSGSALANNTIDSSHARSIAILNLPTGATVTYARLYWSAGKLDKDKTPDQVTFSRPVTGGFSQVITPDVLNAHTEVVTAYPAQKPDILYQSSRDVTTLVQTNGTGLYQVAGIPSFNMINQDSDIAYVGWSLVVFYRLDSEPLRNLTLFDGINQVDSRHDVNITINGFQVPAAGFDAKLGIVAYEGDETRVGDSLLFNGKELSNALNPKDNFFNSTRSNELGAPISNAGDLPRMLGTAGSMSGIDLDIVSVTSLLKAGDTKATIVATSDEDIYYPGVFVTSISTLVPDFSPTVKDFTNETSHDKTKNRRGDIVEYTIDVKNTGTDAAINTVVTDLLPAQVTYQAGSLVMCTNNGTMCGPPMTDVADLDAGEVIARKVTVRIGDVPVTHPGDPVQVPFTIKFKVKVDANAIGTISNQAEITAQGKDAVAHHVTTVNTYQSGAPGHPGMPTTFDVFICATDTDCKGPNEHCDTTHIPTPICTNDCTTDNDCKGGEVCDKGQCEPTTDLMITAIDSLASNHATITYAIAVQNLGPTPAGATVSYTAPAEVSIQSVDGKGVFTCTPNGNQVQCVSKNAMQVGENDEIDLVVAQVDLSTVSFRAEVAANGITDSNLKNNVVELNTLIPAEPTKNPPDTGTPPPAPVYELSGGGFWGCSASANAGQTDGLGLSLLVVSILALGAYQVSRRVRKFV